MKNFAQDVRYAFRMLTRSPGFTTVAVLTLALGIGANAAIFSVVNGLFLNPPGVKDPDHVVVLRARYGKLGLKSIIVSAPDLAQVNGDRKIFQSSALEDTADFNYNNGEWPERLRGAEVSWQWFDVFGARPALGRVFTRDEDQPSANYEVVLAYETWRRLFGSDMRVVGRTIRLNEREYRIVGVMGKGFKWPNPDTDLWTPLGLAPGEFAIDNIFDEEYLAVARLQPNVSFAQASAYVNLVSQRVIDNPAASFAKDSRWGIFIVPLTTFVYGDLRTPVVILGGAVSFVLLIACANIAGLLLAKAANRSKEIAVRVALGASRRRLLGQILSENIVLGLAGILAGLVVAHYGIRVLLRLAPANLDAGQMTFPIDGFVLIFSVLVGFLAVLIFASAPAWYMSRKDPSSALHESGRSATGSRGRQQLRSWLVAGELALGLVLSAGTGLLLKTLDRLADVNPGFQPHGVMSAALSLPQTSYDNSEKQITFFRAVLDRLSTKSGVRSAGAGFPLPFTGTNQSASFSIEGRPAGRGDPGPWGDVRYVTPGYFTALGIPLLKGRLFMDQDRQGSQAVAVIDENMAQQYWPNEDPIGKRLRRGGRDPWAVIVGVVGHIRFSRLAGDDSSSEGSQLSSSGVYYFPMYQTAAPSGTMGASAFLVAKSATSPQALTGMMRETVHEFDKDQPVSDMQSMDARIAESLGPQRFAANLLALFASLATALAAIGLYGLVSYNVAQRTSELGIRMALGANRWDVLKMILAEMAKIAVAGAMAGVIMAMALARVMQGVLFGVSPYDPTTFAGVSISLILVAMLASYIPARRAMQVDPLVALRYE
jgi:predicted permease